MKASKYALAGPKKLDELIAITGHWFRITPENDHLFVDYENAFNRIDKNKAGETYMPVPSKILSFHVPEVQYYLGTEQ